MNEEIKIIDAVTDNDFLVMSRIHAEGWRVAYAGMLSDAYLETVITDDHWVPIFQGNQNRNDGFGLIAYRGDSPVGCIVYGPARAGIRPDGKEEDMKLKGYEGWAEIHSFYSDPAEIGKGYGHLLMETACARLREDGYQNCFVLVNRDKPLARKFYADHGFAHDGTQVVLEFDGRVCYDLRYIKQL